MSASQFDPPRRDPREAAEVLEQALADACAAKSAHDADTGELIRIDEMLAVASEAARQAIATRRKAGLHATPMSPSGSTSHRLFDDRQGVRWDVWAVYPEGRPSQLSALPATFQSGWLVFESASEKRRLSPIPNDWQTIPEGELEQLCDRAVSSRRGRSPGR